MAVRTNSAGYLYLGGVNDAAPFGMCVWVKYASLSFTGSPSTHGMAMYRGNTGTGSGNFGARVATDGTLQFFTPSGNLDSSAGVISAGTWYHLAIERATSGTGSANYTCYLNGVSQGTVAGTATDPADATYGVSRDIVNGGYRCDISVCCFRAFNSDFGSGSAVITEANSTTVVKSGSYFDARWATDDNVFAGFTEGNSGQATTDASEPGFNLGGPTDLPVSITDTVGASNPMSTGQGDVIDETLITVTDNAPLSLTGVLSTISGGIATVSDSVLGAITAAGDVAVGLANGAAVADVLSVLMADAQAGTYSSAFPGRYMRLGRRRSGAQ